jgi:D-alanyl-lipoteichoic acid acyltransferase DltB (MBOAT superfamily)
MLFNTPEFIFLFLPIAVAIHFLLARRSMDAALIGTAISSLIFYAWWNPPFVAIPVGSIAANFWLARRMAEADDTAARRLLILGVAGNLLLLCYYKYAGFIGSIFEGTKAPMPIVPLALSFTTFVQIAFLVDVHKRRRAPDLASYSAFVLFFPHLIAGPIVRWSSLGRQLRDPARYQLNWDNISLGLVIFTFGLVKKVLIADSLSPHTIPVYETVARGEPVTAAAAYGASFGYMAQIYFDFSGYSDMAIGLGLLFNYRLPVNFAAPLRSPSTFELWRRWHVTLSRFFRDFVYVPLGFGRPGPFRRAVNLMITMVLAGLWHGANWTFVAWGAYNGLLLLINFVWRSYRGPRPSTPIKRFFGWFITLFSFGLGGAFFRANDIQSSWLLIKAMAGMSDAPTPDHLVLNWDGWVIGKGWVSEAFVLHWLGATWSLAATGWVLLAFAIALLVPDTMEIVDYRESDAQSNWRRAVPKWRPTPAWLAVHAILFVAVFNMIGRVSEFLYYQF